MWVAVDTLTITTVGTNRRCGGWRGMRGIGETERDRDGIEDVALTSHSLIVALLISVALTRIA